MNTNPIKPLITGLIVLAGVFYLFAIIKAGIVSVKGTGEFNEYFGHIVTVIGGVLSTNFGAVLGVTLSPPGDPTREGLLRQQRKPFLQLHSSINENDDGQPTGNQKMQILACYFYVVSLVVALIFWLVAMSKDHDNKIISVLPELAKTLLGVFVGALTVGLGRK